MPDTVQPVPAVVDLLAAVPSDASWATLPTATRDLLAQNAERDLAAYRAQWGAGGLVAKESLLLGSPDSAISTNFDAWVAAAFATEINPTTFKAHTDVRNSDLLTALKKLYLDYFATRRVAVKYLADLKDWDGADLHDVALPDAEAIAAQKAYAQAAMTQMLAISPNALTAVESALREKATYYFRQLATASSGWAYGGDDLLTPYGIAAWAVDLPYRYSADGGKIFLSDKEFLQIANAYYFGQQTRLNVGTARTMAFVLAGAQDPDYIKSSLGDPAESAVAKGYTLLTNWYAERVAATPEASAPCTVYTDAERTAIWNSFTADSLADNEGTTSMATFAAGYADAKTLVSSNVRSLLVAGLTAVFPSNSAVLTPAQRDAVIAAVNAEAKPGLVLDTAYAAMDAQRGNTAASDLFKAKMAALVMVGGYADPMAAVTQADREAVAAVWNDVRAYIAANYGGLQRDLLALLPTSVAVVNTAGSTAALPDGSIKVVVRRAIDKASLYRTLFHEAKHAIDMKARVPVEGAALEGSALALEQRVGTKAINTLMSGDPLLPLYHLKSALAYVATHATTDATLSVFMRPSCNAGEPNSIAYAASVAASWGLSPQVAEQRADRVHFGTQYLGYDYGRAATEMVLDYLQAQLPANARRVDPYLLQACAIQSPRANAATASALRTCLRL